ncbi:uncharacterized protein LOC106667551 isoform X3 [Cimex lectularius]|uniref:PHD-type domain-containing protein n=1 Tax=Cimex lectularius TaxID=79782 RepID=A0A8I6RRA5_CIMLE|nr:uncharacterized protein LOC106667551 isoform X3 [Cimex lectularius]
MNRSAMKFTTLESFPEGQVCCMCKSAQSDLYKFGQIYKASNLIVHYFCLLQASKIKQNGTDNQGIWGFLLKDIKEEVNRGKSLRCSYCLKNGATIHCCKKECRSIFHLSCGIIRGTKHLFFGEFKSYCDKHNKQQVIPISVVNNVQNTKVDCVICLCPISVVKTADVIWPMCCKPKTLLHRLCVQKMAFNAGYYFKCPLCNNKSKFRKNMKQLGIYIPNQEAAWEQEPNAYQELLINSLKCEAESCICPEGREFEKLRTKWHMLVCSFCGVNNIHVACAKLLPEYKRHDNWKCSICIKLPVNAETVQSTTDVPRESVGSIYQSEEAVNNEENLKHDTENSFQGIQDINNPSSQSEAETVVKDSIAETTTVSSTYLLEEKHNDIENLSTPKKHYDNAIKDGKSANSVSPTSPVKETHNKTQSPQKPKLLVAEIINIDSENEEKDENSHKIKAVPVASHQKPQNPRLLDRDVVIVESDEELENAEMGASRKRHSGNFSSPQPLKKQACLNNPISQQAQGEPITFFMMSKEGVGECLGMSIVKRWNDNKINSLFLHIINSYTVAVFLTSLIVLNKEQYECYVKMSNRKEFSLENFLKHHPIGELLIFCERRKLLFGIFIAKKETHFTGNNNKHLFSSPENRNDSIVKCSYYKNPVNLKQMMVLKAIKVYSNSRVDPLFPVEFKYLLKSSDTVNFCKFILSITVGNLCFSICDNEGKVYGELFNSYLPSWVQGTVICYTEFNLKSVIQETIISLEDHADTPFTILLALANFDSVSCQNQNSFFAEIQILLKKYPKVNLILTTVLCPKDTLSFLCRQIRMFNLHLINMSDRLAFYYWDIRNINFYSLNSKKKCENH